MNRSTLNIVLLVAVAALGTALYFGQKKDQEKKPPLTMLTPAAVNTVTLEHPDKPAIKLEKQNGSWKLTAPVQADVDTFQVNALLGLADQETESTLDASTVQPKELGLDPPSFKVMLNEQAIEFGGEEPLKFRRYVRHDGKIALINDPSTQALDADYSDLISKAVVPSGSDIAKIAVPGLTVEKKPDGTWTSPEQPAAKPEQLQKFVDSWKAANAMWNTAAAEEAKGEAAGVTLADGREVRFVIVSKDPQFVLANPALKISYTLSKADADTLLKLPEETKPEAAEPAEKPEPKEPEEPKP